MASDEESSSPALVADTQHDDDEWDEQKDDFTLYYKTQNNTLKKSTELMIQNHNFHATQRQWERKIVHWGLQKYTSRKARLDQIESQGRTIAEVAELGRRPHDYLQPSDDRNVRRFARREQNRSRSRSRSTRSRSQSFNSRSRSVTPNVMRERSPSAPDIAVQQEQTYAVDFSALANRRPMQMPKGTPMAIPAYPISQDSPYPQAHIMQTQNMISGEMSQDVYLSVPDETLTQGMSQIGSGLTDTQFGYEEMGGYPSGSLMDQVSMSNQTMPFPTVEMDDPMPQRDYGISQTGPMAATSPSYMQSMNTPWNAPHLFTNPDFANAQGGISDNHSSHSSFHQTPTEDLSLNQNLESNLDMPPEQALGNVPDLILPEDPSPRLGHASPAMVQQEVQPNAYIDNATYQDFHSSVSRYTQAVQIAIMSSAPSYGASEQLMAQLSTELQDQGTTPCTALNNRADTLQAPN